MKPIFFVFIFTIRLLVFTGDLNAQSKPDALAAYRSGNYAEAAGICRAEIQENRQNIESYVVLCWSLVKLRRFDEARTAAETALAISPYDARLIEIMGEIGYFQGRNSEALKHFQDYIYLAPEGQRIDVAYYYSGEIYIRLGRFKHADIALSTAVHYVPENAVWQTRLAYARENSGELRQAAETYEKALSLDPQLADARRGLDRVRANLIQRQ
ncbi:MAG: tetratricopeptide repeat protein [Spirochaetaceae bacterium]|jgi:tetratricopeptide (TPR) repeat protein|nr:tetratricopeptide repeat protein [Spirochaetaceae bacterium]